MLQINSMAKLVLVLIILLYRKMKYHDQRNFEGLTSVLRIFGSHWSHSNEILRQRSLTAKRSHSMSQQRDLTACHSEEVLQQRNLTAKRSHCKEILQQRGLTDSKEISEQRGLIAKRYHRNEISQKRDLAAKKSHSKQPLQ